MCRETTSFLASNQKQFHSHGDKSSLASSSGGFRRCQVLIQNGLLALLLLYGIFYYWDTSLLQVSPEYCSSTTTFSLECHRPDLKAYQLLCLVSQMAMGLWGAYHWHISPTFRDLKGKMTSVSPEKRLFGHLKASDIQNVIMFTYQVSDLVLSFAIPENFDPIFIIHHILAIVTSYCSLEYQMVSFYSMFYGGCSEISSIFLVFCDINNRFVKPPTANPLLFLIPQGLFFATFSYYRIIGWIYYSVPLWKDVLHVLRSGSAERYRPGKTMFLKVFLFLNVTLGALQCYWYREILSQLRAVLSG